MVRHKCRALRADVGANSNGNVVEPLIPMDSWYTDVKREEKVERTR